MMLKLRPLVVVTGTIHVEGGATSKRSAPAPAVSNGKGKKGATKTALVTEELQVTDDRGRANSIIVTFSRALRKLTILRAGPLGLLIDPANMQVLQDLSRKLTLKAIEFNKTAKTAEITNCWLIEPLTGVRRAAVEGWVAKRLIKGDKRALAARAALEVPTAAPVAPAAPAPPAPPAAVEPVTDAPDAP